MLDEDDEEEFERVLEQEEQDNFERMLNDSDEVHFVVNVPPRPRSKRQVSSWLWHVLLFVLLNPPMHIYGGLLYIVLLKTCKNIHIKV